ncbi:bacteriohemerythrin [Alkaliphilus hydrothermalis]|uniref:Hemerythrin n=1 Tax=Alkaliphilus hydrothermalis TaxID=1482730 RepID=A0ABS2NQ43_9FIRM|nr:bacteriohemerythrin [Alkaliphilus hydrothermalis]MBM7615063.1 hemerythrin [Alkaliphilus hydrothermalis]
MFGWDKMYETNIQMVDQQHKRLVELINQLNAEVIAQLEFDNYDRIMEILGELKDYTVEHFQHEESLMKDAMGKFDDEKLAEFWAYFKNHKNEHADFVNKVEEVYCNNIDENQVEISIELIDFLVEWIKNHILKIDLQLEKYIV